MKRLLYGFLAACVLAMLLGLAWPADAQDTDFLGTWLAPTVRVPVSAAIVNSGSLGYRLGPEFGAGLEVETDHFASFTSATFGLRHKVETGDGHEVGLTQRFCGRRGPWLACGGFAWNQTVTSRWSKGSVRPIVGGGWEGTRDDGLYMRALVEYEAGTFDAANGLHGLDAEIRVGRPAFYYLAGLGVYRFHATGNPGTPDGGWRLYSGLGMDLTAARRLWR
jgi:hypothetical protein